MGKFKVGDKVKVIKETSSFTDLELGKMGEVVEAKTNENGEFYRVLIDTRQFYHRPEGLELAESTDELKEGQIWYVPTYPQFQALIIALDEDTRFERASGSPFKEATWWDDDTSNGLYVYIDRIVTFTNYPYRIGRLREAKEYRPDLKEEGDDTMENKILHTYKKVGSRSDTLTVKVKNDQLELSTGCFTGTLDEFEEAVKNTHANNIHGVLYNNIISTLKLEHPDLLKKEQLYVLALPSFVNNKDEKLYMYYSMSLNKIIDEADLSIVKQFSRRFTEKEIKNIDPDYMNYSIKVKE